MALEIQVSRQLESLSPLQWEEKKFHKILMIVIYIDIDLQVT